MQEIPVSSAALTALGSVLDTRRFEDFTDAMERAAKRLQGRTLWHINSTSEGGGVAEILRSVIGYIAAFDIDVRWDVIDGSEEFFELTKRIHNMLHGADGTVLEETDRALYEGTLSVETAAVKAGDVVILHDPQTVGLAEGLRARGCDVLWSCHIGADEPNRSVKEAWGFLLPYASRTQAQVFSRLAYVWEELPEEQIAIIPPCIDPCATKNKPLDDGVVQGILETIGRRADVIESAPTDPSAPLVVQISRWDALKDPIGVMRGFAEHVEADAHLILAGPAVASIDDDPESNEVLDEVRTVWEGLPEPARARVHLACLPMDDVDENATMVNALQRRADVVVQKSKAEGFGLTVAEAMWKAKPVVGSRVGGIQDQIQGETGLLVDPDDLPAFGSAVEQLLQDRELSLRMGKNARERAEKEYLTDCYLARWMDLIERVSD